MSREGGRGGEKWGPSEGHQMTPKGGSVLFYLHKYKHITY
jgi:hypothetical protein